MNKSIHKDPHRYDDMLDLPHYQSAVHPHMSVVNRAAQFSPFAALTGYEDEIRETARLTDEIIKLSDQEKERLNQKLQFLSEHSDKHPTVSVTYFVPDAKKSGGAYRTDTGIVKRIDPVQKKIVFYGENERFDGQKILSDTITEISCDLFRDMDYPASRNFLQIPMP